MIWLILYTEPAGLYGFHNVQWFNNCLSDHKFENCFIFIHWMSLQLDLSELSSLLDNQKWNKKMYTYRIVIEISYTNYDTIPNSITASRMSLMYEFRNYIRINRSHQRYLNRDGRKLQPRWLMSSERLLPTSSWSFENNQECLIHFAFNSPNPFCRFHLRNVFCNRIRNEARATMLFGDFLVLYFALVLSFQLYLG